MDRYQLTLDCRPMVKRLAGLYQRGATYKVQPELRALYIAEILRARQLIPVDVMFTHGDEPYATPEEMRHRIAGEGVFIVKFRDSDKKLSHYLRGAHMDFRAVHDWYGHVACLNAFNMDGELGAYCAHARSGLFSPAVLPLVWSEVVLENAFRLYHGHWSFISRPVYDPDFGRAPEAELLCLEVTK